ncbi:uncharacterized protein LOC111403679 isoform X2 [Olea europaea subsp. europaea]|uniref:Uncharacterized protein LOC111403679 isoform X2 n=1 Tax=Olea europaea subsp. europaea TaxID=158383 RepID=A0A8S0S3W2_OLEEU|nr:uncharacterized protein LOC111403679 isoform X2 [Olea europaea subsp. europaea]
MYNLRLRNMYIILNFLPRHEFILMTRLFDIFFLYLTTTHLRPYRRYYKKRSYDTVDYECIDKTNFWIVEEVPPRVFEYEDLDNAIYEENAISNVNDHEFDDNVQDDNENKDEVNTQGMGELDTMDVIHCFGGSCDRGNDQGLRLIDENDKDEI